MLSLSSRLSHPLIAMGCVVVALAAGCSPGEPERPVGTPLVKINDATISVEEFQREYNSLPNRDKAIFSSPQGRQEFLRTLVSMELLHQEGVRQGVDKDAAIRDELERQRRHLVINYLLHENIGMAEILRYFQDNYAHARHIVLTFEKTTTDAEKESMKKVIERIRERAAKGEDFVALSRQYSKDKNATAGGDLGYISRYDSRLPGFPETVFAMKEPNEISPVLTTPLGHHIIQLLEKPGNLDPRGLTPELQNEIIMAIGQDRFRTYLAELYPQADIQYNQDALHQIGAGMTPAPQAAPAPGGQIGAPGAMPPGPEGVPSAPLAAAPPAATPPIIPPITPPSPAPSAPPPPQ